MTTSASRDVTRRRRNDLLWSVERAETVADVFSVASARLRKIVPFDAAAWVSTDPCSGLPNGPTLLDHVEGVSASQCSEHWRREFLGDDVNLFRDLVRAPAAAAALRVGTTGQPDRSRRFRTFLHPHGFDDELRAVLRSGETQWATISLMRHHGQPAFTDREARLVASLAEPLGAALRARAQPREPVRAQFDQPGLLVFNASAELISINDQARAWLGEMPPDQTMPTDLGVDVPVWLLITVFQASARPPEQGAARSRLRSRAGAPG